MKLLAVITAIFIPAASRCQTWEFTQAEQYIVDGYGGYYNIGFGSFQDSFTSPIYESGAQYGLGENSTVSGLYEFTGVGYPYPTNVVSFSGKGQCFGHFAYASQYYNSYEATSAFLFSFTNNSPLHYLLTVSLSQSIIPPDPSSGSSVVIYGANTSIVFGNSAAFSFSYGTGPLSGTSSGILEPGQYTIWGGTYVNFANSGAGGLPVSDSGSWQVVFTLSSSNIVSTSISGYITDACTGLPITNATVQIGPLSVLSGVNGYYSQSNLPPAAYTVIASTANYAAVTNTVTTSAAETSVSENVSITRLNAIDYFGVGVNWQNVTTPANMNGVRGDLDASDLYDHLQTDLSSIWNTGTIVDLDATQSSANNLSVTASQFNEFATSVCQSDTVVFYVSSHGGVLQENGVPTIELAVSDDFNSNNQMDAVFIATLLNSLPVSARKIVILDACSSGGIANSLADSVKNISILASASGYPVTVGGILYDSTTSAEADGTGVFTDALDAELDQGVYNLGQIIYDILLDHNQIYASLEGQNLNLKNSGSAIFTGLQPQLWEGVGFTGNLASNTANVVQSPPAVSGLNIATNTFQLTLTNVPSVGSIAIEMSTNLISWLQVAFDPAAGTNLTFSFSTTNNNAEFFRTKVVP